MIETPTKTDSNKNSNINNKNNEEISENKIITDYSLPNLPTSEKIIKENIISDVEPKKISQIHEAIISDNLEKLANLLKLGGDPDIIDKSGETPLYMSVDIENYDAMIILLEFGADCNIQKEDGNTPLHLATEKKNDIYISSLLSHGANPNIINKINSQTPLHIGIINKINEFILVKFKEAKGDIYNIKDKFDKTPFDYSLNDEKYKNLLFSIFGKNNLIENSKSNENYIHNNIYENNEDNSNLDYNNFITLSRKIQLTDESKEDESKEEENNKEETIIYNKPNNNQNKETDSNNINDVNNCLKKQLLFSSNSKELSSEKKENKKLEIQEQNSEIKDDININKNMINILSEKGSNLSNQICEKENINPNINLKQYQNKMKQTDNIYHRNLTEIFNKNQTKSENLNKNYILTTLGNNPENKIISHSLNLSNKNNLYYIKNNKLKKRDKSKNQINHINTLYSNTNGNNSLSSLNLKKEGISDINPLEMINQAASSNNSNIFSELQVNSNEKINENKKTEEEYNDNNYKMTYNDGINTLNENISENFSITNNNYNDEENNNNKENINFNNNSFDDSLEYSKSKSFNISDTPGQLSQKNNNENFNEKENEVEESLKINNKDESMNIYTNLNNINININNCYSNNNNNNIERYKSTTSNKSKQDFDNESEQSCGKLSSISNISVFQNKSYKTHYRHLSYHNNNRQSSNSNNNNNKSYNSKSLNNFYNNNYHINKENVEPNYIQSEKTRKNMIKSKNNKNIIETYTIALKKKILKDNINLPEIAKEQKTKDSTLEDFRSNENIILINENSNYNIKTLDNTNQNQFNTYCSDNNSNRNNTKESYKYSNLFKKALKKKFVVKEFSANNQFDKFTLESDNYYNNTDKNEYNNDKEIIIHPQQISNDLITKLRDWLISCDLLCYYNILIKNNIYDIESYITNLRNNKINISYKDVENFGIKKPGHIFRFLLKLQMDIGILDNRICNFIINKFSENCLTTLGMNVSVSEIKYCGFILCPGEDRCNKNSNYYDIFSFLRCKELIQFKENFIHNGFDQIEFILIQLFSCFAFNREILNDYMHIYSDKDKKKVIIKLYEEKKNLMNLMGMNYNDNEVKQILDESIENTENSDMIKSKNFCNIF